MEPNIVKREAFVVMGVVGHFTSAAEDFGPLWEKDYMVVHSQIDAMKAGEGHYGVYLGVDHSKPIDYMAGMAVRSRVSVPATVTACEIPAALYAVFECSLAEVGTTWGTIWGEFLQTSPYELDKAGLAFDYFPPSMMSGDPRMQIWLPVKEKVN